MTEDELYSHPGWQWCTFEGAELHTLLLGLKSTFREKLQWLEDAETLTLSIRRGIAESPAEHRERRISSYAEAKLPELEAPEVDVAP